MSSGGTDNIADGAASHQSVFPNDCCLIGSAEISLIRIVRAIF